MFKLTTSNLGNLIARKKIFVDNYSKQMFWAQRRYTRELLKAAQDLSRNHDYVQRHTPPFPYSLLTPTASEPWKVNIQEGNFHQAWHTRTVAGLNTITTSLFNTAVDRWGRTYSQYFNGDPTLKMMARPIIQHVFASTRNIGRDILYETHKRVIRTLGEE